MNPVKPEDRRIQRTRDVLKSTLIQLTEAQGYENFSVQDLTRAANIGRATFYLHCKDKQDLLWQILSGPLQELQRQFPPSQVFAAEEPSPMLLALFELAWQERVLFQAALESPSAVQVAQHLRTYFLEFFLHRITHDAPQVEHPRAAASFLAGGVLSALQWWLQQPAPPTAREITLFLKTVGLLPVFEALQICQQN